MSVRRNRLARLLTVRTVALQAASHELGKAIASTAALTALADRISQLQVELTPAVMQSSGQQLKATAATRNGLQHAAGRQLARLDAATAHQANAASALHRDRAATGAVERAIERCEAGRAEAAVRSINADAASRKRRL